MKKDNNMPADCLDGTDLSGTSSRCGFILAIVWSALRCEEYVRRPPSSVDRLSELRALNGRFGM